MDPRTDNARMLRLAATPAERRLWQRLRAYRLGGCYFRRQHPIGPYIADFVCLKRRLVVELDGGVHELKSEYDQIRSAYLKRLGYRVLRFPNSRVMLETDAVLKSIEQHLSARES